MTLTWLITTTTYGSWLPGDSRGSVDNEHNQPGEPFRDPVDKLAEWSRQQLKCPPIRLSLAQAEALLSQLHETSRLRGWIIHSVAIMANHWHAVVSASDLVRSEKILADLKSYGSRRLNQQWSRPASKTWWTESGSRRRLADEPNVEAAVRYVAEQEHPLVIWISPEFESLVPTDRREMAVQRWRIPSHPSEDVIRLVPEQTSLSYEERESGDRSGLPLIDGMPVVLEPTDVRAPFGDIPTNRGTDVPTNRGTDVPTNRRTDVPTNRRTDVATNRRTDVPRSDGDLLRSLDNAHVWHPFTAMSAYRDERAPIIVDADGFFLVDTDGNRYLDGHSSLWCNIHGHRVSAIDEAIRR